jgi:hypothetical protein
MAVSPRQGFRGLARLRRGAAQKGGNMRPELAKGQQQPTPRCNHRMQLSDAMADPQHVRHRC